MDVEGPPTPTLPAHTRSAEWPSRPSMPCAGQHMPWGPRSSSWEAAREATQAPSLFPMLCAGLRAAPPAPLASVPGVNRASAELSPPRAWRCRANVLPLLGARGTVPVRAVGCVSCRDASLSERQSLACEWPCEGCWLVQESVVWGAWHVEAPGGAGDLESTLAARHPPHALGYQPHASSPCGPPPQPSKSLRRACRVSQSTGHRAGAR